MEGKGEGKETEKRVDIGKEVHYPKFFLWEFTNNYRSFKSEVLVHRHCHISGMAEYFEKIPTDLSFK